MTDADVVARLDAIGPIPGCPSRPAGLTRLLALRLHAIARAWKTSRGFLSPKSGDKEVLASDLGPVLLEYLNASGVEVALTEMILHGERAASCRGVVVLDTLVSRLLPRSIARIDDEPLEISHLSDPLRLPEPIVALVTAGELHRLNAKHEDIPKLAGQARYVESGWRDAYPELAKYAKLRADDQPVTLGTPADSSAEAEDRRGADLKKRKRAPRQKCAVWTLADKTAIRDRQAALIRLREPTPGLDSVLEGLALRAERKLSPARLRQAEAVTVLAQRFPNFAGVCSWVVDQVRLCALIRAPLHLPPVLLVGPPGIGKTMFSIELAHTLNAETCVRSLAELSASWLITGNSTQWSNGRPGIIADYLSRCSTDRVPWFVFDELDKATGDRGYPVGPALLGLLEPYTAQRFRDECLEIEMDIRPAGFIFTANDLSQVRQELISRLHVIAIPAPTPFEMPAVVASVDAQLRKEQPALNKLFAPINAEVSLHLGTQPPRELRRNLQQGYANAVARTATLRGKRVLQLSDLPGPARQTNEVDLQLH